jgi:hypothetical protein
MNHLKSMQRKLASDKWARIVSDLLNPLTLPLLVFGVAGLTTQAPLKSIAELMAASTLLFFIIPFLAAVIVMKINRGTTSDFRSRPARNGLYLISCLSVGLGGLLFFSEIYSGIYRVILVTYFVNLLIAMGINFKWKVSVHVGSAITASVLLFWLATLDGAGIVPFFVALIILVFLPILAWARIQLRVHSRFEIMLGGLMGLTSTTLMISLLV